MEPIQIFDNLSQAAEIANKEGKLGLQDSLALYQSLVELAKVLDIQETLEERAKAQIQAQAPEKVTKVKTTKKPAKNPPINIPLALPKRSLAKGKIGLSIT